mgnify:CR=1 FL=1
MNPGKRGRMSEAARQVFARAGFICAAEGTRCRLRRWRARGPGRPGVQGVGRSTPWSPAGASPRGLLHVHPKKPNRSHARSLCSLKTQRRKEILETRLTPARCSRSWSQRSLRKNRSKCFYWGLKPSPGRREGGGPAFWVVIPSKSPLKTDEIPTVLNLPDRSAVRQPPPDGSKVPTHRKKVSTPRKKIPPFGGPKRPVPFGPKTAFCQSRL